MGGNSLEWDELASSWFTVRFSNALSSLDEAISDQLKRDVLVEGSAASRLVQRGRCCSVTVIEYLGAKAGSMADSVVARGKEKSKVKSLSLEGGEGVLGGVPILNGLQLVHVML